VLTSDVNTVRFRIGKPRLLRQAKHTQPRPYSALQAVDGRYSRPVTCSQLPPHRRSLLALSRHVRRSCAMSSIMITANSEVRAMDTLWTYSI
jgi:hypothetical protein